MKKSLILCLVCLLVLCGCGKTPELKNGEEAIITFKKGKKEHQISVDELYASLKEDFGLQAVIKLVDDYVLETEFKDYKKDAEEQAESYIKMMQSSYESSGQDLLLALQQSGYSSIEAYQDYLYTTFMQSHALEEYAKTKVTDKEIEKYYKDDFKGDIEVYHILITPDVKDGMSTEDQEKAETKAKDTAKDIIKKLDKAENKLDEFKKLVKEYTDDDETKDKDGNLGYINYNSLGDENNNLLDAAYKLKDGEYSKDVVSTELGYHVIYRNKSKDKAKLEDAKEDIIETLSKEKISNGDVENYEALKYYRELYGMKITDSEIEKQYGIYLNNLANSTTTQQ